MASAERLDDDGNTYSCTVFLMWNEHVLANASWKGRELHKKHEKAHCYHPLQMCRSTWCVCRNMDCQVLTSCSVSLRGSEPVWFDVRFPSNIIWVKNSVHISHMIILVSSWCPSLYGQRYVIELFACFFLISGTCPAWIHCKQLKRWVCQACYQIWNTCIPVSTQVSTNRIPRYPRPCWIIFPSAKNPMGSIIGVSPHANPVVGIQWTEKLGNSPWKIVTFSAGVAVIFGSNMYLDLEIIRLISFRIWKLPIYMFITLENLITFIQLLSQRKYGLRFYEYAVLCAMFYMFFCGTTWGDLTI